MSDPHRKNKRLYALDEAAVGPEEAPKRWQMYLGGSWQNLYMRPTWLLRSHYRRDPEAPPLPSLDWHEAPGWANWMAKDLDDIRPAWFECKPSEKGWDLVEQRPNSQWFDLTRPDYEASKEDDMDEYLTGPALHRAIADAMEAGEGPEAFEYTCLAWGSSWGEAGSWTLLVDANQEGYKIRRKPRMRHLTDMHGQRWEWPEPLQHEPSEAKKYFFPDITDGRPSCYSVRWKGSWWDKARLNRGFCFLDDDACMDLSRALIAASGGNVD